MKEKIIVALDNMDRDSVFNFIDKSQGHFSYYKIGLELYCQYGNSILLDIEKKYPHLKFFLDLKLHDIPSTVFKAIRSLESLPIEFLTIHLQGGREMINEALKAKKQFLPNTKLLGVSYLTSLSPENFQENWGIQATDIKAAQSRLFNLASDCEIDGVVLSPMDLENYNLSLNTKFRPITVCPGIRLAKEIDSGATQDQKRVLSPKDAFKSSADYLVMGRSITTAANLDEIVGELSL